MTFDFNKHDGGDDGSSQTNRQTNDDRPEPEDGYTYHPRLYRTAKCVVEATLGEILSLEHDDYGQTLILYLDDTEVVQGALYDKNQDDENDPSANKIKLYSLDDLGYAPDEFINGDLELSGLPSRYTETFFGETHRFDYMASRISTEDGESILEDNPENLDLGTTRLYFDASEADADSPGPGSESKRVVRLLAENGVEALNESNFDGQHGWADSNISVADELLGRRVRIWTVPRPVSGDEGEEDRYYNHLIVEDVETGEALPVRNSGSNDTSDAGDSDESADEEAPWEDTEDESSENGAQELPEVSDDLREVLQWCQGNCEFEQDTIEAIHKSEENDVFEDDLSDDEVEALAGAVQENHF